MGIEETAPQSELPIVIRRAIQEDVPFIFNSWLKSYRSSSFARSIPSPIYFAEHHKLIERLLKKGEVFVVCDEKNPSDIYAYMVAERVAGILVIHFAYTKQTYRQLGLAKMLLAQYNHDIGSAAAASQMTQVGESIARKYGIMYSPYLGWNNDEGTDAQETKNEDAK